MRPRSPRARRIVCYCRHLRQTEAALRAADSFAHENNSPPLRVSAGLLSYEDRTRHRTKTVHEHTSMFFWFFFSFFFFFFLFFFFFFFSARSLLEIRTNFPALCEQNLDERVPRSNTHAPKRSATIRCWARLRLTELYCKNGECS